MLLFGLLLALLNNVDSYRILGLFPGSDKSHFMAIKPLIVELAKSHQVDVVSQFPLGKSIPNYREISIPEQFREEMMGSSSFSNQDPQVQYLSFLAVKKSCELLSHPAIQELIQEPPTHPPYDAVIVEVCEFIAGFFYFY